MENTNRWFNGEQYYQWDVVGTYSQRVTVWGCFSVACPSQIRLLPYDRPLELKQFKGLYVIYPDL